LWINLRAGRVSRPFAGHFTTISVLFHIIKNAVGIQAFSTILIDARYNWWGKTPPDDSLIWGENINFKPWLEGPEEKAFTKD